MKKKAIGIIAGAIVLLVMAGAVLLFFKPWLTKEERILNEIQGAYARGEYIGVCDSLVYPPPIGQRYKVEHDPSRWIYPTYTGSGGPDNGSRYYSFIERRNVQYTFVEIDKEFLNNGLPAQGVSLRQTLIPNVASLDHYKEKYAIFINDSPDDRYAHPLFYLDGELYTSFFIFKLERVDDAKYPLTIQNGSFPKDSIMNELAGKTYHCEYFQVNDPESRQTWISYDMSLEESENVQKCKRLTFFGSQKYMERYENNSNNSSAEYSYQILEDPEYEIIELDKDFYYNGTPKPRVALHRLIDSVEELDSYEKKYAIIINLPVDSPYIENSITYFYLDGKLYYSPQGGYQNKPFPMEAMEGIRITE